MSQTGATANPLAPSPALTPLYMSLGAWDILEGTNFSEYNNLGEWDIYLRSQLGLVIGVIGLLYGT